MKISQRGLDLIKQFEGFYSKAYLCPANTWTIGWGLTKYSNGKSVKLGDTITQSEALSLLEKQVNEHSSSISAYVKVELNQNQFDALASFQYNLGKNILKGSKLLEYLNAKNWNKACETMMLYNKANGKVLQGLTNRRKAEISLFKEIISTKGSDTMSYTYRKMHVYSSKYLLKCPNTITPQYLTIHNTYNDASANNEATYHNNNNNQVSFHIAIDDIEAVEVIPLNRNAWHCGDGKGNGNMKSIGIEICYSKSGGAKYDKAEQNAILLIAKMLHERKWNIDRVRTHKSWSGKHCPHRILDKKDGWKEFLNRVQKELNKLNGKSPTPPINNEKDDDVMKFTNKTTQEAVRNHVKQMVDSGHIGKQWLVDFDNGKMTYGDYDGLRLISDQKKSSKLLNN